MGKQTTKGKKGTGSGRRAPSATKASQGRETKKAVCLKLLRRRQGASVAELQDALGWQAHSVRGLLSGTVRKLANAEIKTITASGKPRRYRVIEKTPAT